MLVAKLGVTVQVMYGTLLAGVTGRERGTADPWEMFSHRGVVCVEALISMRWTPVCLVKQFPPQMVVGCVTHPAVDVVYEGGSSLFCESVLWSSTRSPV